MGDADFDDHRQFLIGVAYRMLGSVAEAEDVVQDAFLRWAATSTQHRRDPRAYLARIVVAAVPRSDEVGGVAARAVRRHVAARAGGRRHRPQPLADDLSVALLLTLERLSPLERAAFLLHDVFDMDYAAIAEVLGRTEAACRQLAARAREHVREDRPRFDASDEQRERLTDAFRAAIAGGNVDAIAQLLADDAVLYSDGGGKRPAALQPIRGKDRIVRFFDAVRKNRDTDEIPRVELAQINGLPGFVIRLTGRIETMAFELADDRIVAIY